LDELLDLGLPDSDFWLNYTKGRAYYCLNNYKASMKHLKLVLVNRAAFELKINSFFMIAVNGIRMVFKN